MHYDGPGDVPGAPGTGYGYDVRVVGRSSADPPSHTAPAPTPAVPA
jgi:20S proteasome subunit beta 5